MTESFEFSESIYALFNIEKCSISECLCSLLTLLVSIFFPALKFLVVLIFLIVINFFNTLAYL